MLLQCAMPAAHVPRCGEGAVQSLRRKARPPTAADTAAGCAERTEPATAPRFSALRHGVSPGRVRCRGEPPTVAAPARE